MTPAAELRHGYAELADVRLHYVEAGEGPLVVLLHGFPEFWYGWRGQIGPLAAAGFRIVAPDLRGYNLSSKPKGAAAYNADRLAADVRDLIHERGAASACVAGHDWGGVIAWATAMRHPQLVRRLAILNAPHPGHFVRSIPRHPDQLLRSWYTLAFQVPWLPERVIRARDFGLLREGMRRTARPGAFTDEDLRRYAEAWSQPGALSAMLAYYRSPLRDPRHRATADVSPVTAPTRVIWGRHDRFLNSALAEPDPAEVPGLERVFRLETSHWVQHDEPERVAELLIEFFSAAHEQDQGAARHEGRRRRT